jgi:hypothetical protein
MTVRTAMLETTSIDTRASIDDASSNSPKHAIDNGQYATKPAGTTTAAKRQT